MKKDAIKMERASYMSKNIGAYLDKIEIMGRTYLKIDDLRYGTNPHQPAAFYRPEGINCPIGEMKIIKTGKSGLSQTNLEDISYALNIVKFFKEPACAVMKHVNPSGVAIQFQNESIKEVYAKARDCDKRAAFGSVIAINQTVDAETAAEIMETFVECVVASGYAPEAVKIFNNEEKYKLNKHIRILQCGDISQLPAFAEKEKTNAVYDTMKVLADGSLVIASPLLTSLRSVSDLAPAEAENKSLGKVKSEFRATYSQLKDLLSAWFVNINVRSNGVVIMKNGQTLSVGTGEQDRVGAIEQAVAKYHAKYTGTENISDSVMASDGFFPFADGVEVAAAAGIKAIISPPGSIRDAEVIARANELKVALYHAPERIFSHH
jgi:phosphoribosylaminoimidazolecarboxamide formyltransferase/IMP cyclohydrolase